MTESSDRNSEGGSIVFVILICILSSFLCHPLSAFAEEYSFDISETEKKPYHLGGYAELRPVLFGLDKDATLYRLKYYNNDQSNPLLEINAKLLLEGSLEYGISRLYVQTSTDFNKSSMTEHQETTIYQGFLSLKPSNSLTIDAGKKTMQWGKGYAWNPVAFIDRPKDPDEPDLSREGVIVASADFIKSFGGPLKTLSFTPVLFPVYEHINNGFGEINKLNFAGKIYLLLYDTDIDFIILTGGSKTTRYGLDFSRNISTNLEIHGEFAFINNFEKNVIDSAGKATAYTYDAKSYLLGIRYLTERDTTYICEYYHNGTGFSSGQMNDFFSFVNSGYASFQLSGSDALLKKAKNLTEGGYGRVNPMKDYLYLRISQKEPFDVLYFTPAVTWIANLNDKSFSVAPELLYTAITNLELRLKAIFLSGPRNSEFGEKQNNYRVELRARYYF